MAPPTGNKTFFQVRYEQQNETFYTVLKVYIVKVPPIGKVNMWTFEAVFFFISMKLIDMSLAKKKLDIAHQWTNQDQAPGH